MKTRRLESRNDGGRKRKRGGLSYREVSLIIYIPVYLYNHTLC